MRNFLYNIRLKNQKRRALFEVTKDIEYLKKFKGDMLEYDEGPARRKMSQLKKQDERTDEEEQELMMIVETITESKAVKNEFEKSDELRQDLQNYISML